MDIDSNCPSLLFGETTSHLTSKLRCNISRPGPSAPREIITIICLNLLISLCILKSILWEANS